MGNLPLQNMIIPKFLEQSSQVDTLNKTVSPWVDTKLIANQDEGPVVIKTLKMIKSDEEFKDLVDKMKRIQNIFDPEKRHPNLLPYYHASPARVQQTTVMLRQYICYNLSEKIRWLPHHLSDIEKKWLIFQLLCGVAQIHAENLVHGDIKPENILVTSYNQLYIADIHPYKPVLIKDDNMQEYNKFFGYLDNNLRCYVAPERWKSPQLDKIDSDAKLDPPMDIFSTGCVIAEILMDNLPLFDLANLQKYRRGTFDPSEELAKKINDKKLVELIKEMISRDPAKRPSIYECLKQWNQTVFPGCFSQVLFQIGSSFQRLQYLYSDNRISLIRYHINSIFEMCLGEYDAAETFQEPIEPAIFNLLEADDTNTRYKQLLPQLDQDFQFYLQSNDISHFKQRQKQVSIQDKNSLLLIVLWIGNLFQSSFYPQTKLVALEMIKRMAAHLEFQVRLDLVLPLVQTVFFDSSDSQSTKGSNAKVKVKALDVMLGLFHELEHANEQQITISALDFKVSTTYILPLVKRLMELKGHELVKTAVAQNLGRLARITTRFLEVSISSSKKRRNEAVKRNQERKGQETLAQIDTAMTQSISSTNFGNNMRTTFGATKREDLYAQEANNPNEIIEEDLIGPSYDTEKEKLWETFSKMIENIIGEQNESTTTIIQIFQSFIELSQVFGLEKSDFLIQQCISGINRKDFRTRLQVIKTLSSLSFRVGQQKIEDFILFTSEKLLEDPEDLVILENIKMLNNFLILRLITKQNCLKLLNQLTPLLVYPNSQIRLEVAKFICQLLPPRKLIKEESKIESEPKNIAGVKIFVSKKPLFTYEEFYCAVRPKIIAYIKDCFQLEIMESLESYEVFIDRMKAPLNLKILRAYFIYYGTQSQKDRETQKQIKEDQFIYSQFCPIEPTNDDVKAYEILANLLKKKLMQSSAKQEVRKQASYFNQDKFVPTVYRVIKQNNVQTLASGFQINNSNVKSNLPDEVKVKIIQQFTSDSDTPFCLQNAVTTSTNFGLNPPQDPQLVVQSIPFEMFQILKSLEVVPSIPETKTFRNLAIKEKGDVNRLLRVNSQITMAIRGAQASVIDQFDQLPQKQVISFKIQDSHREDFKNTKGASSQRIKPQGQLLTTFYEHKSSVNTVAVSDDQTYFMTGSHGDKTVQVYSVKDIQSDFTANVLQINTQSSPNQICTVQNSANLAVATEKGIEIYDFSRLFAGAIADQYELRHLEMDEVLQVQSMQLPITYQNVLVAAKQNGSMLIYDLRARQNILKDECVFNQQRGAISAMCIGKDAYTLTIGTLGGYVNTYDIRYGVTSALFKHHMNWPVLAVATYRNNKADRGEKQMLLSLGGPQHEMCQLNMETGAVEVLYRIPSVPVEPSTVTKQELTNIPEFSRETCYKDNKFGTLKRDGNLRIFERSLLYLSQSKYEQLLNFDGLRIQDSAFLDMSTQRFKRISESYTCPNACRKILIPRDKNQSFMFDNETADYAITAGNDRKIRYWSLTAPERESYQINSPFNDEVEYLSESITKTTKIVMEKQKALKEFPKMTTTRIKDQTSVTVVQMQKKNNNVWVEYPENTAHYNAVASIVKGKHLPQSTQNQSAQNQSAQVEWNKFQIEENKPGYVKVNHFSGVSQSQHLNNLAICPDPVDDSAELRDSDVVSHQDSILDMALCNDMLITCGRDGLVKLWK